MPLAAQLPPLSQRAVFRATDESRGWNSVKDQDRLNFGHFNSPIGSFSLLSREVDQYGRVRSVDLFAFDDPNSRWDMNVKIHDGAMLQIKRRWGASSSPGPYSAAGVASAP
jgi:hypothetical protein